MPFVQELLQNRLFAGLPLSDLEALVAMMTQKSYQTNEILFRKGDMGSTMYIVLSGSVRIYIEDEQRNPITFRIYGPREVVGEFSILDQQPRSAFAAANEPLEVILLDRNSFLRFLKERPLVGLALMRNMAERIRYTTMYLEKMIEWTQWLSNGEYDHVIRELAASSSDDEIQQLITTFLNMVRHVQQREEKLKKAAPDKS